MSPPWLPAICLCLLVLPRTWFYNWPSVSWSPNPMGSSRLWLSAQSCSLYSPEMKLFASQLPSLTLQIWFPFLSPNIPYLWVSQKVSENYHKQSPESGMLASSQPCWFPVAPVHPPISQQLLPSFCPWPHSLSQHSLPWRSSYTPTIFVLTSVWMVPRSPSSVLFPSESTACWMPRGRIFTHLKQN